MIRNNKKLKELAKPCSELQTLAQKENYALFQLKGMLGQLVHINKVTQTSSLKLAIQQRINFIKEVQQFRKAVRDHETKSKKSKRN